MSDQAELLDTIDMLGATMGLPEQIELAHSAVAGGIDGLPTGPISSVLLAGMGGSGIAGDVVHAVVGTCLLYTSPSPRDISGSRMPSSA